MHPNLAKKMNLSRRRLRRPHELVCVNGKELITREEAAETVINVGRWKGRIDLLAAEASQQILLGFDLLRKYRSSWDLSKGLLTLQGEDQGKEEEEVPAPVKLRTPTAAEVEREFQKSLTWGRM